MKLIFAPDVVKDGHHHINPPESVREFASLKATALDAERYPILAKHWDGVLIVGDKLAINDNCRVKLPKGVQYD